MRTVAKIESDFNPRQRTGSYVGLFQLSKGEFTKYGSGEITSPRDNAIAAAYKFATEAALFELDTGKKPTFSDLYLIHQQGWRGAAEHVSQPDRIAWKSMCATEEGREKGEKWCKRAIWLNTLPTIKRIWQSVEKLTSGAFIEMWRERVESLYALYAKAVPGHAIHDFQPAVNSTKAWMIHRGFKHVLRVGPLRIVLFRRLLPLGLSPVRRLGSVRNLGVTRTSECCAGVMAFRWTPRSGRRRYLPVTCWTIAFYDERTSRRIWRWC